jgi:hypothetical protein
MKTRFSFLLILFPALFSLNVAAQGVIMDTTLAKTYTPKKATYGLQVGSMFSTAGGYGSSFSTFISPHMAYSLSSRFSLEAGISIITTNFTNARPYYSFPSETGFNGNLTSAILYLSGNYRLNDRLMLSGSVFKEIGISGYSKNTDPFSNQPAQGIYMNADYKVTDHFHIQAGFGYSKGLDPYRSSIFQQGTGTGYNPFVRY